MSTVEICNGHLHYEAAGDGRPVVFLHAGGLTSAQWDAELARFSAHHKVIRYDARGHGDSSDAVPTQPYTHAYDLRELLDALDIERAMLVGCSMGSRTAIDFALTCPERVEALVLTSPGISGMNQRDPFVLTLNERIAEAIGGGDHELALELVIQMLVDGPKREPEDVDPAVRAHCRVMFLATGTKHPGNNPVSYELDAIPRVHEIAAPILVITGELDYLDIHGVADHVARHAMDARKVVVPGAGHMLNLDRPDRFAELLTEFLSR
ncbi:alpha/beta fold hydrolase [Amycolatopsis sp. NPDC058986]|uniref:alpha/beta fold hydrolase n=1 Tax=unclassified Amycolatopsis TaxID=2618356 RepID=UPI00366D768B